MLTDVDTCIRARTLCTRLHLNKKKVHLDSVVCYKIVFNLIKVRFDDFFLLYSCYKRKTRGFLRISCY